MFVQKKFGIRFSFLLAAAMTMSFAACSDDSGNGNQNNLVDAAVHDATHNDDAGLCANVTNPCDHKGATRCVNGAVQICGHDANRCLLWQIDKVCSSAQTCVDDGSKAQCECNNDCTEGKTQCDQNMLQTCSKDQDDCLAWTDTQNCSDTSTTCLSEGDSAHCGTDCSQACEVGTKQCHGYTIQTCVAADPCPVWQNETDCTTTNQYCDDYGTEVVCNSCVPPADGCLTGYRCTMTTADVFACFPDGTQSEGENCSTKECKAGLICMQLDSGPYQCLSYCQTSNDCAGDQTHCIWPWKDTTEVWGFCRDGCDPIQQTGCNNGEACYFSDPDQGSTLCWATGTIAENSACDSTTMCVPGSDCVVQAGTNPFEYYCRRYCDTAHPCDTGFQCIQTEASGLLKMCFPNP